MKQISLTRGLIALVDNKDYSFLSKWKWSAVKSKKGTTHYAHRNSKISDNTAQKKRKSILMHRVLMAVNDPKIQVDHKDHNGLNNQRKNIRVCTNTQNQYNRRGKGVSKYLGVNASSSGKKVIDGVITYTKWKANILVNGKDNYLGHFNSEKEAAKAYNEAAQKYHGDFANLNIIV